MAAKSFLWIRIMGAMLIMALAATAHANIWLDEDFEAEGIFQQRDGSVPGETGWDTLTTNPLIFQVTDTVGYAEEGSRTTAKAFQGEASYHLEVGQALAVGIEYQDPQNGNFQIFQFAVNVDPIPAAGDVALFRWNHDMNSLDDAPDHSFYVRLESNGSSVTIYAGEDLAHETPAEQAIGTLSSTSEWAYITMLSQKSNEPEADSRFPFLGAVDQGMHFFNSSESPAFSVPYLNPEPTSYAGRDWAFDVMSGGIYLDEMYWDGGLDSDSNSSNFRPFDLGAPPPTTPRDWIIVD